MSPNIQYDEFEVEVRSIAKGRFEVRVLQSPCGRTGSKFVPPYTADRLDGVLSSLERSVLSSTRVGRELAWESQKGEPTTSIEVEEIGRRLFKALFPKAVEGCLRKSLGIVRERGGEREDRGLRLRITFDRSEDFAQLATLPWEVLWDSGFINRNRITPVVRALNVPEPPASDDPESAVRVMLVPSNPRGMTPLATPREARRVKEALGRDPRIEVTTMKHPNVGELRRRLVEGAFHVVHFMGHGDFLEEGRDEFVVFFEGKDREAVPVKSMQLAECLQGVGLRLVVLNSCWSGALPRRGGQDPFTGVATALVSRGSIPAVVAMQFSISDDAAIAFSRAFYERLAAKDPVSAAVTEGRLAILEREPESLEWATPVVFLAGEDHGLNGRQSQRPPLSPPVDEGHRRRTEPLRLAIRSFKGGYASAAETPDDVLDLTPFFKDPDGRHIKAASLWREEVYPRLHDFLRRYERERRPVILDLAAHATIAFTAGYCLEAKSGLDVTLLQRSIRGVRSWRAEAGPARGGRLWKEEEPIALDATKPAMAMAVSATTTILPDVDLYLRRSKRSVGRIVPMSLCPTPSASGVEDGLHALQLAQDLTLRIRARSAAERMKPLHLFASAPNALLFFLGQLARSFGQVQLYEHDFPSGKPGAYIPSLRLPVPPTP